MNELKMTEIETLSWFELERLVNDLKKKGSSGIVMQIINLK